MVGLSRGGTQAHAGCRDGSGLEREGRSRKSRVLWLSRSEKAMAWARVGQWRWREADCFERFLKIKRMDLAADDIYMVGTKKWKKTKMTVEFLA